MSNQKPLTMKKEFIEFLKKRKVYTAYKKNLREEELLPYKEIEEFLDTVPAEKYLCRAFRWSLTEEGALFWRNLNSQWEEIVETVQTIGNGSI